MESNNILASKIRRLAEQGEGVQVEFKECNDSISKNIYETVCAFLNRSGGELLLGVNDSGRIIGVDKLYLSKIKADFTTAINNPQKISPSFYLSMEDVVVDNKTILYIYVPESSQVHRCQGKIFDRNADGDFNITDNHELVSALYLRKQTSYSENKIYPYAELCDLREGLIERVKKMAALQLENHPWKTLSEQEFLNSTQLYGKDYQTGKTGITLAGILLFGKDNTILSVIPHFKTDAILRRDNVDRYDDRDDVRTNLIDSYDRLYHFGEKHLNDPFYLEADQRISLRSHILREVVSNLLIHREFTHAYPARMIIEREQFYTENSNKPHNAGIIDPAAFSPYPKNPTIARIFREIGRADDLGSGVRKLFKYCKAYCGSNPALIEGDIFKFKLPLTMQATMQATMQVTMQATPQADVKTIRTAKILEYCLIPRNREEIQAFFGFKNRDYFRKHILAPLLEQKLLHPTIPNKLTSPKQKYYVISELEKDEIYPK